MKKIWYHKSMLHICAILCMIGIVLGNFNGNTEVVHGSSKNEKTEQFSNSKSDKQDEKEKKSYVVVIDPGHQAKGNSKTEPNGPGSKVMKAKVTSGTTGRYTGLCEYKLNLTIGKKLKKELESRGYTVYMTREEHEVDLSNKERAEYATKMNADIFIRIHANGCDSSKVSGALCLAPSKDNPYVSDIAKGSQLLSKCIIDSYCKTTKLKNRGVTLSDTMSGINWCTMPVSIIEMGYMTNRNDDTKMANSKFQKQMVRGIANGIDQYFKKLQ